MGLKNATDKKKNNIRFKTKSSYTHVNTIYIIFLLMCIKIQKESEKFVKFKDAKKKRQIQDHHTFFFNLFTIPRMADIKLPAIFV